LHLLVKMRRLPFRRASAQRAYKGSERRTSRLAGAALFCFG
jgi:hypothetical protein